MLTSLVITIIGPDKPGLVSSFSDKAAAFGANWEESWMANVAGQFAGIVHLQVPAAKAEALVTALRELEALGLHVAIAHSSGAAVEPSTRLFKLELVGQDRPGIVRDISRLLADRNISIEELDTELVSGSWSGENLFQAKATLRLPATAAIEELRHALEGLANELMVDLNLDNTAA
ncbi:MAG: ACT domain-containing protein [Pseudomonadota bacterium]